MPCVRRCPTRLRIATTGIGRPLSPLATSMIESRSPRPARCDSGSRRIGCTGSITRNPGTRQSPARSTDAERLKPGAPGFNKMVREVRAAGLVAPIVTELHNAVRLTFTRPGFAPLAFKEGLSADQVLLLDLLFKSGALSTSDIVVAVERPRRSVQRDLQLLAEQGRVELVGSTSRARWEPVKDL
jgi:hypothetical protein